MNIDKIVMSFAGTLVLIGVILGVWVNSWWLILPAFIGLNLLQAGFTGFCPAAMILKKMHVPAGQAFKA